MLLVKYNAIDTQLNTKLQLQCILNIKLYKNMSVFMHFTIIFAGINITTILTLENLWSLVRQFMLSPLPLCDETFLAVLALERLFTCVEPFMNHAVIFTLINIITILTLESLWVIVQFFMFTAVLLCDETLLAMLTLERLSN